MRRLYHICKLKQSLRNKRKIKIPDINLEEEISYEVCM